jgi:hypothetical protein
MDLRRAIASQNRFGRIQDAQTRSPGLGRFQTQQNAAFQDFITNRKCFMLGAVQGETLGLDVVVALKKRERDMKSVHHAKAKLALASLLVLASAGAASAKNISFDGYCDGMNIKVTSTSAVATSTGCATGVNEGVSGKVDKLANLILSSTNYGSATVAETYVLEYPLRTGNSFTVYITTDGITQTLFSTGTYTMGTPAAVAPGKFAKARR